MMPSLNMFCEWNVFFELTLVFCGIIINQLLLQLENIRFFYLTMVFIVEHKTFLIE
jgi:hypothetical protein